MTVRRPLVLVNGQLKELPDGDPLLQALSYPADRPALLLDFVNSQRVDPRLTFSRSSVGTYLDRAGVLRTAAVNAPRIDYDPVTGVCRGLLMEPERTNLYYPCKSINAGVGTSFVANAAASLDGTLTAGKLIATATNGPHEGSFGFVWTASLAYTVSFDVWPMAGITGVDGGASSTVGGGGSFSYVFATQSGSGATFRELPGGGVRIEVTLTPTATASAAFFIRPVVNGSHNFSGDGVNGLVIDYVQVEQAASASSRIYTSTGPATRAADAAQIGATSIPGGLSATAASLLCEATLLSIHPTFSALVVHYDLTGRFVYHAAGTTAVSVYDGSYSADGGLLTPGAEYKFASSLGSGGQVATLNGGAPALAAFDGQFGGSNTPAALRISRPDLNAAHCYIRRVAYWPRQLSNSELQAITT